jgi:hypothetical protein
MEIRETYVIFELVANDQTEETYLVETKLSRWRTNSFDTEYEAIQCIKEQNRYADYFILKKISIT